MRKRLLVAGGAALILLGACGGDGDTDTAERDTATGTGEDEPTQVIDFAPLAGATGLSAGEEGLVLWRIAP